MKRIMAFALTLCLLLSLVSPIPVAATQSADLIYKETVERALEEYGKLRFTESSMDCIATGVFKILLLDFNGDGQNELVIMHRGEDDGIYPTIDVWTVRNGQPQQIFSDKQRTIAMEPVSTVEIYCDDDTVYIPMYGEDGVSIELYGMQGRKFTSMASYDGWSSYLCSQYTNDGGKMTFADGRELREHTCAWYYVYGLGMDDYENEKADMQNTLREDMEESLSWFIPADNIEDNASRLVYKEIVTQALKEHGNLWFQENQEKCVARGVFKIDLLDFNQDGIDELMLMYSEESGNAHPFIEVWTVKNEQAKQVFSGKSKQESHESEVTFSLYENAGFLYLPVYDSLDQSPMYVHLYGFDSNGKFGEIYKREIDPNPSSDGIKFEVRNTTLFYLYNRSDSEADFEDKKAAMQKTLQDAMDEILSWFFPPEVFEGTVYDYEGEWLWQPEDSDHEGTMCLTAESDSTLVGDISFYRLFGESLTIDFPGLASGTVSSESGKIAGTAVFGADQIYLSLDDNVVYNGQTVSDVLGTTKFHFRPELEPTSLVVEYAGASVTFEDGLFEKSSYEYDNELAKLGAMLNKAACDGENEICQLFSQLGIENYHISNYNYHGEYAISEGEHAFSIAHRPLLLNGLETNLIFIVARGSKALREFIGDGTMIANREFLGYNAYYYPADFEEKIWNAMLTYANGHEDLYKKPRVFFITGYSLGGAAANLTAAMASHPEVGNSWIFADTDPTRIFAYTYGAIDSIKVENPVENEYEYIHNIYNFYDTFGPNGRDSLTTSGNSGIGKFGHMDVFAYRFDWDNKLQEATNHKIENYLRAIDEGAVECKGVYSFSEIHCPVDVEVLKDGEVVGRITDNQVDESLLETHPDVTMMVVEDSKYVGVFGEQEGYSLRITATDDGEMTVSTTSFNEEGESYAAAEYPSVKIDDGQVFSLPLLSPDTATENAQTPELLVMNGDRIVGKVNADGSITNISSIGQFVPYIIGAFASVIVIAAFIVVWSMHRKRKGSKNN